MEHNKAVLASQENEMKEYLKRQQVSVFVFCYKFKYLVQFQRVAEKHIKQFSPALPRKNGVTAPDPHGAGKNLNQSL